ncbi:hypothetical protein [Lysinibacillus sp. NPDC092081]|uniref:hypothetical protein n=1 Tax=Lysinibacillus sp. NPDC092081 TaxID=3364131 RepID=UPI00382A1C05
MSFIHLMKRFIKYATQARLRLQETQYQTHFEEMPGDLLYHPSHLSPDHLLGSNNSVNIAFTSS